MMGAYPPCQHRLFGGSFQETSIRSAPWRPRETFLLRFFSLKHRAVFRFVCCADGRERSTLYHFNVWIHHSKVGAGAMPEVPSFKVLLSQYHLHVIEVENSGLA